MVFGGGDVFISSSPPYMVEAVSLLPYSRQVYSCSKKVQKYFLMITETFMSGKAKPFLGG